MDIDSFDIYHFIFTYQAMLMNKKTKGFLLTYKK